MGRTEMELLDLLDLLDLLKLLKLLQAQEQLDWMGRICKGLGA